MSLRTPTNTNHARVSPADSTASPTGTTPLSRIPEVPDTSQQLNRRYDEINRTAERAISAWNPVERSIVNRYENKMNLIAIISGLILLYGLALLFMFPISIVDNKATHMAEHGKGSSFSAVLLKFISILLTILMKQAITFLSGKAGYIASALAIGNPCSVLCCSRLPAGSIAKLKLIAAGKAALKNKNLLEEDYRRFTATIKYLNAKELLSQTKAEHGSMNQETLDHIQALFLHHTAAKVVIATIIESLIVGQSAPLSLWIAAFALPKSHYTLSQQTAVAAALALTMMILAKKIPKTIYKRFETLIGHMISYPRFLFDTRNISLASSEALPTPSGISPASTSPNSRASSTAQWLTGRRRSAISPLSTRRQRLRSVSPTSPTPILDHEDGATPINRTPPPTIGVTGKPPTAQGMSAFHQTPPRGAGTIDVVVSDNHAGQLRVGQAITFS